MNQLGSGGISASPRTPQAMAETASVVAVDQNSTALGEHAADLLLAHIESKVPVKPRTILLEPQVIVRDSSLRKRA